MFSVKLKQGKFKMITSLLILNTTVDSKTIILFYSGSTKLLWLKTKYVQYFERSILSWQFAPPTIEGQEHRFGDTHVPPLAHGGLHIAGRKGFGFKYYHNTLFMFLSKGGWYCRYRKLLNSYGCCSKGRSNQNSNKMIFCKVLYACIRMHRCGIYVSIY